MASKALSMIAGELAVASQKPSDTRVSPGKFSQFNSSENDDSSAWHTRDELL